jgi:RES domain-containing protein
MTVFRLCKSKYSKDLSGLGAGKTGGRWNSKGKALIYTSSSRALCVAEIAVHTPFGILPKDYKLITINIPDEIGQQEIKKSDLPKDWYIFPHPNSTQAFGDNFISESNYLVLKVPSSVVQGDFNYLINPEHQESAKIKILSIEPFQFDTRLFIK